MRSNALLLEALSARISEIPAVDSIRLNRATGSLVVYYDPALCSAEAMLQALTALNIGIDRNAAEPGDASAAFVSARKIADVAAQALVEALARRSATALISALI